MLVPFTTASVRRCRLAPRLVGDVVVSIGRLSAHRQECALPLPRGNAVAIFSTGAMRRATGGAEREWSQAELAGRVHVSRQAINSIERGKCDPSLGLAVKIAKVFDVSIERVFLPDQPRPRVR